MTHVPPWDAVPSNLETSVTSFGPAMMYARTIFNCTGAIQCSGHGECVQDQCDCDPGWSGLRCDSWLLSPPYFGSATGPVPPGQTIHILHNWDCPYKCYTTDNRVPECGVCVSPQGTIQGTTPPHPKRL